MQEEAHTSPGIKSRTVGQGILEHQAVQRAESRLWMGSGWKGTLQSQAVQGRGTSLAEYDGHYRWFLNG